jgi:ABC-type glycerol-3-phosphate transport system substrate-binding protein
MATGTNPSIAATPQDAYWVAFQASNGYLTDYSPYVGASNRSLGMASGSSPSMVP